MIRNSYVKLKSVFMYFRGCSTSSAAFGLPWIVPQKWSQRNAHSTQAVHRGLSSIFRLQGVFKHLHAVPWGHDRVRGGDVPIPRGGSFLSPVFGVSWISSWFPPSQDPRKTHLHYIWIMVQRLINFVTSLSWGCDYVNKIKNSEDKKKVI